LSEEEDDEEEMQERVEIAKEGEGQGLEAGGKVAHAWEGVFEDFWETNKWYFRWIFIYVAG